MLIQYYQYKVIYIQQKTQGRSLFVYALCVSTMYSIILKFRI